MYGYERCRKDFSVHHHELHARLYAIERKNKGRIPKPRKQEIIVNQPAKASGMLIYDRTKLLQYMWLQFGLLGKHSWYRWCVLTHYVKTKCWFDDFNTWLGVYIAPTQLSAIQQARLGAKVGK